LRGSHSGFATSLPRNAASEFPFSFQKHFAQRQTYPNGLTNVRVTFCHAGNCGFSNSEHLFAEIVSEHDNNIQTNIKSKFGQVSARAGRRRRQESALYRRWQVCAGPPTIKRARINPLGPLVVHAPVRAAWHGQTQVLAIHQARTMLRLLRRRPLPA
jgi:hypothetical protein